MIKDYKVLLIGLMNEYDEIILNLYIYLNKLTIIN